MSNSGFQSFLYHRLNSVVLFHGEAEWDGGTFGGGSGGCGVYKKWWSELNKSSVEQLYRSTINWNENYICTLLDLFPPCIWHLFDKVTFILFWDKGTFLLNLLKNTQPCFQNVFVVFLIFYLCNNFSLFIYFDKYCFFSYISPTAEMLRWVWDKALIYIHVCPWMCIHSSNHKYIIDL